MAKLIRIDSQGATAASLAENVAEYDRLLRDRFGEDLSMTPQTPQAQIAGINALRDTEIGEAIIRAALFGSSVDHAEGTSLDALGSLLDIQRLTATRSRVTATLTGVAGVGVPAGSRAKTDPDGDEFQTLTDAVLSPSGVAVEMESVEEGPVEADAGTLTRIVTVINGWETVTNSAAASVGINRQSDSDYRSAYEMRTAHSSIGPMPALEGALEESMAGRVRISENNLDTATTLQEWAIRPHSIFVIVELGSDADVQRAIENHRGMGVGTITAISGGSPDNTALDAVSNGTVTWNGTDYDSLDLTSSTTSEEKATALTTHLSSDERPPTIRFIDGRYVAIFPWMPIFFPAFGTGTVETAFGLDPDNADYPEGPFIRPRERSLTVTVALTRRTGFASDGLTQVRENILDRVGEYGIGEELWSNDLLCEAERVPGTRITSLTVLHGTNAVSGVAVPLDNLWDLPNANLTINVT